MKIVIANSAGIDREGWSIIPYHSRWTTASKGHSGAFTYYPRDLGYLSSLLKRDTDHDVTLADGCLQRLNAEDYAAKIIEFNPEWLVMENSSRTFSDDARAAQIVKNATGAKILLTGQHVSAFPDESLEFADVIATGEYLASVRDFFANGPDSRRKITSDPGEFIDVATLPFPEDDDVSRYDYALKADPICGYTEAQVYATRGCPYNCLYCVARYTYFQAPQWRARPVGNVVEELRYLTGKYSGLEGFFFDDEIHNANIKYTKELARAIIAAGLNDYRFEAMCAYAPFDREALELIKEAGYYKVRVGIETASESTAEGMKLKGKHRPEKLRNFLDMAKQTGIEVYGTFTLGGKGSSEQDDKATVALMAELLETGLLGDCQVSICTPQPGTPFYDWARAERLMAELGEDTWRMLDGGEEAVVSMPGYDAASIKEMRRHALAEYDRARSVREGRRFRKNWARCLPELGEPKRVLIFRSSRNWHLDLVIESSLKQWGGETGFLCHEQVIDTFNTRFPGLRCFQAPSGGFLNQETLPASVMDSMRSFQPDLILVPSITARPENYRNVIEIAGKVNSQAQIFMIDSAGIASVVS